MVNVLDLFLSLYRFLYLLENFTVILYLVFCNFICRYLCCDWCECIYLFICLHLLVLLHCVFGFNCMLLVWNGFYVEIDFLPESCCLCPPWLLQFAPHPVLKKISTFPFSFFTFPPHIKIWHCWQDLGSCAPVVTKKDKLTTLIWDVWKEQMQGSLV